MPLYKTIWVLWGSLICSFWFAYLTIFICDYELIRVMLLSLCCVCIVKTLDNWTVCLFVHLSSGRLPSPSDSCSSDATLMQSPGSHLSMQSALQAIHRVPPAVVQDHILLHVSRFLNKQTNTRKTLQQNVFNENAPLYSKVLLVDTFVETFDGTTTNLCIITIRTLNSFTITVPHFRDSCSCHFWTVWFYCTRNRQCL